MLFVLRVRACVRAFVCAGVRVYMCIYANLLCERACVRMCTLRACVRACVRVCAREDQSNYLVQLKFGYMPCQHKYMHTCPLVHTCLCESNDTNTT